MKLMEDNGAERLMNTLISKMESIDNEVQLLKAENLILKRIVETPSAMLKKAGYISVRTPLSEDIAYDPLRGDMPVAEANMVAKSDNGEFSNADIHNLTWSEIHEMAEQTREVKEMY